MIIKFLFVLIFLSYFNLTYSIYGEKKADRNGISNRPNAWIIDCKEKRECVSKCAEMSVTKGRWGGDAYVNQIRTECLRECTEKVICLPDEK
ncbi:hypothetical protein EHQ82_01750 [Leptospira selangorensis]|uniref:Cys-rich protein n=1 Tax=Leptospira selangorensis TaxID=2484982 RepID=A0ABY2NHP3_9LEPT|nr:hypothetical protein EHQ82_01750 [Leptospira selangorensis]